ncbi:MAG: IS110 family transposase [Gammaproteobacteria bacterium]|nr:IS110 family transposase [Gammaproteobacteria bacterium]
MSEKPTRGQRKPTRGRPLESIRSQVAGIDLGSQEHWVCGPPRGDGKPNVRTYGTTTAQLALLADWLQQEGVESVAMESTHVYWIPLHELLEQRGFEVVLVNARQLKNVPGRKTDMLDCQWLQRLHCCGLLRGSFRPHETVTRVRAIHRQMGNLVAERTRFVQWMQQALDQMNVQVHRAVSDLTGQTGMAIVRAIVKGERDPEQLAALRHKRCRHTAEQFAEHLSGNWRDEHLYNLEHALALYDAVQERIQAYEERLEQELRQQAAEEFRDQDPPQHPNADKEKAIRGRGEQASRTTLYRYAGVDLTRIDGISAGAARMILTEAGPDLSAFPTEKHFVSWLHLAPRTAVSGGKPLAAKRVGNGMGATRVAQILRMCAVSLQRSKTALGAALRRKARHKGMKVAIFATARKLAVLVYRMLRWGHDHIDIGEVAYEASYRSGTLMYLQKSAHSLGYRLVPNSEDSLPLVPVSSA